MKKNLVKNTVNELKPGMLFAFGHMFNVEPILNFLISINTEPVHNIPDIPNVPNVWLTYIRLRSNKVASYDIACNLFHEKGVVTIIK